MKPNPTHFFNLDPIPLFYLELSAFILCSKLVRKISLKTPESEFREVQGATRKVSKGVLGRYPIKKKEEDKGFYFNQYRKKNGVQQ